jgi:transposase
MFDGSFKKMAIDLFVSCGSVKSVSDEFVMDESLLSKWRQGNVVSRQNEVSLKEEQKLIKKLQKELEEAQLDRNILKKAVGIFSNSEGRYSDL